MAGDVEDTHPAERAAELAEGAREALGGPVDWATVDPAHEAYQLRLQGKDWRSIAEETGYASHVTAQLAVTAYLQRAVAEVGSELAAFTLQTELDRLDALQAAWWAQAVLGDDKAAKVVLDIIRQRSRLMGLDAPMGGTTVEHRTIVIDGTDMARQLRAIAEQQRLGQGDTPEQ